MDNDESPNDNTSDELLLENDEDDEVHVTHLFTNQFISTWIETFEGKRRKLVIKLVVDMVYMVHFLQAYYHSQYLSRTLYHINYDAENIRGELMAHLTSNDKCRAIIRMSPNAFARLCSILRDSGRMKDTIKATVKKQVAQCLCILGHGGRNRSVTFFFRRSREIISRHFHNVLRALITLEDVFLQQPIGIDTPSEIMSNNRFNPYFKDCIGAIDGTHIRVKVPLPDAPRFRGRKDYPTQNVLAACSFDLKFTYVLPGWEGTASDSRIIKNALTREDKLIIPQGKFYLVDDGFMLTSGLIGLYRGVRYHLKEYSVRGPEIARELFNNRYASLRNAIERAFGVLKKRFVIISRSTEPQYPFETQTKIVLACYILHNYLMGVDPDTDLIAKVDRELAQNLIATTSAIQSNDDYERGSLLRDEIANAMWRDYSSI